MALTHFILLLGVSLVGAANFYIGNLVPIKKEPIFQAIIGHWYLDFQKNLAGNKAIVDLKNFPAGHNIVPLIIDDNNAKTNAIKGAMKFSQGEAPYPAVTGTIGHYSSSVTMPTNSFLSALEVPQISWGATNNGLSNKGQYPYFLRTIPPDSIQAKAAWGYFLYFNFSKLAVVYTAEPYGMGMYEGVAALAQSAKKGYAVEGRAVLHMEPTTWDSKEIDATVAALKGMGTKVVAIMYAAVALHLFMADIEKALGTSWQFVGSETIVMPSFAASSLPGLHGLQPASKGSLYGAWWDDWKNLKQEDYASDAMQKLMMLDKLVAPLDFDKTLVKAEWFSKPDTVNFYTYFLFDALYAYAFAIKDLLDAGKTPAEIKGKTLLDAALAVKFDGITGSVEFDSSGDRKANYDVVHLTDQKKWQTFAVYSASADTFTLEATSVVPKVFWRNGMETAKALAAISACPAGFAPDATDGTCRACQGGFVAASEGSKKCDKCGAGTYSNTNRTTCVSCSPGSFSVAASSECKPCAPGTFQSEKGKSKCEKCPAGEYQSGAGNTTCMDCGAVAGQEKLWVTAFLGATALSDCMCPQGMYLNTANQCQACGAGVFCAQGSSEADLNSRCAGNLSSLLVYPRPAVDHYTTCDRNPLEAFFCLHSDTCSGSDVDACPEGAKGYACGTCGEGWHRSGKSCRKCDDIEKSSILCPILPLVFGPLAICVLYKFSRDTVEKWMSPGNAANAVLFLILVFFQTVCAHNTLSVVWPAMMQDSLGWADITMDFISLLRPSCVIGNSFQVGFIVSMLLPVVVASMFAVVWGVSQLIGKTNPDWKMDQDVMLSAFFSLYNTFFIGVAQQTFKLFQCYNHPNGLSSLRSRPDILCNEEDWSAIVIVGIPCILVFCGGAFGLFTYIIHVAPGRFSNADFRMRWKFLFLRFRPSAYFWSLVVLGKGLWVILPTVIFSEAPAQISWLGVGTITYLVGLMAWFPWRVFSVSTVDVVIHIALCLLIMMLPYLAIMPSDHTLDRIADHYTVLVYCTILFACGILAKILINKFDPPTERVEHAKLLRQADAMAEVFGKMQTVDLDRFAKIMRQMPWSDVLALSAARRVINIELLNIRDDSMESDDYGMMVMALFNKRLSHSDNILDVGLAGITSADVN